MATYFTDQVFERMEGLSRISDNDSIIVASMSIRDSLKEEGFTDEEIKAYLFQKINNLF